MFRIPESSFFLPNEATQMNSKITSLDEQGELLLTRAKPMVEVSIESIKVRRTFLSAINLCIELSGLEDKEIYLPLGIDAGHFSNLRKGKGHFPPDCINPLMDLCRNEVPLIWLTYSRGYDPQSLRKMETVTERELRIVREQLAKEREEREVERRLFKDLRLTT